MSQRIPVGPADLAEGELRGVEVGNKMLLVVREGGRLYAMDDWCNHAGCLLSGGWLKASTVVCPCHEVGFELASGKVATRPRICDDQQTFPVEERDGQLWVEFEDADLPTPKPTR